MMNVGDMKLTASEFASFLDKLGMTCSEFDELFGLSPGTAERCLITGFDTEQELSQDSLEQSRGTH
jgi:hypothetical protein